MMNILIKIKKMMNEEEVSYSLLKRLFIFLLLFAIMFIYAISGVFASFDYNRDFKIETRNIATSSNIIYKREDLINANVNINTITELTNSLNMCNQARTDDQKHNNEILKLLIGKVK